MTVSINSHAQAELNALPISASDRLVTLTFADRKSGHGAPFPLLAQYGPYQRLGRNIDTDRHPREFATPSKLSDYCVCEQN